MATHDITVSLTPTNRVKVTPNSLNALSTHTVRWVCTDGALRIDFQGPESPLASGLTVAAAGGTTGNEALRKTSTKGPFKYRAEITPAVGGPFSKDPELIVDDGGGGPPQKKKTTPKPAYPNKPRKKKK